MFGIPVSWQRHVSGLATKTDQLKLRRITQGKNVLQMVEHHKPVTVEDDEIAAEEDYIRTAYRQEKILGTMVNFWGPLNFGCRTNPVHAKPILLHARRDRGRLFR